MTVGPPICNFLNILHTHFDGGTSSVAFSLTGEGKGSSNNSVNDWRDGSELGDMKVHLKRLCHEIFPSDVCLE